MRFLLDSPAAVIRLRSDRGLRRSLRRIVVPAPPPEGRHRLEDAVNRAYFACGCGYGAGAVYLVLAAVGALWASGAGPIEWTWWKACMAAFAAGLGGKLAGIALNRRRLDRLLKELEGEFGR